ncbi:nitrate reductase NapD [Cytobacillus eiseniae]|uniref:Chaperone NapD n=1 Tax=Cytobacillus eiseniae TaxID=762947 RepID=A0ABS4RA45_9BACI|nr:chaperone NapD [Cytobacillus eiseniae]MBP2239772.1 nitrate reductase NapD [Cytobacillus eiseniae]
MVISGIYIETVPGMANEAAEVLNKMDGVEVHHIEDDYKIILTVEAETIHASYEIAETFKPINGVLTICLAYSNFEEEPAYQEAAVIQ